LHGGDGARDLVALACSEGLVARIEHLLQVSIAGEGEGRGVRRIVQQISKKPLPLRDGFVEARLIACLLDRLGVVPLRYAEEVVRQLRPQGERAGTDLQQLGSVALDEATFEDGGDSSQAIVAKATLRKIVPIKTTRTDITNVRPLVDATLVSFRVGGHAGYDLRALRAERVVVGPEGLEESKRICNPCVTRQGGRRKVVLGCRTWACGGSLLGGGPGGLLLRIGVVVVLVLLCEGPKVADLEVSLALSLVIAHMYVDVGDCIFEVVDKEAIYLT
jgi:hypothetical protein